MRHRIIEAGKLTTAFLAVVLGVTGAVHGIHNANTWLDQLAFGFGAALALVVYLFLNRDS